MPKNTPLPMQWLTVDGQNVPIVLPDHWDDDKKEWKTTGTGNPLPIANYTQNTSGVWLPTSESNPVPTQLTGSSVELINQRLIVGQGALATVVLTENLSNYKNIIIAIRTNATAPIEWEISASGYNNDDDMRGLIHKSGSSTGFVTDNGGVCFEIPVISNNKMEIVFRHDRSFAIYADYVALGVS